MESFIETVGAQETAAQMSADDAQTAVVSAEEVIAGLGNADAADETAVNEGDGGHEAQEAEPEKAGEHSGESGKRDNQMRAALRQQRRTIFEKDLGMPEEQVRELIRAHKAAELAKSDPEISQKAARMIVEAQERAETAATPGVQVTDEQRAELLALHEEGWTQEELLAFAQDAQAVNDVIAGESIRDAAQAYRERMKPRSERRKAAPIARGTSAGALPAHNPIAEMNSEQFDAFMENVRRRTMNGEKVKI